MLNFTTWTTSGRVVVVSISKQFIRDLKTNTYPMIWTYSDDDVRGESWLIILLKSFKMKILLSSSTSQISTSILSWCWTACRHHRSSARTQTGDRCSDYPPDSRRNSGGGSAIFLLAPEQVGRGQPETNCESRRSISSGCVITSRAIRLSARRRRPAVALLEVVS